MEKMMLYKKKEKRVFLLLIACLSFHWSFTQNTITLLPKEINETSALVKIKKGWITVNDSGNEATIFVFDKKGEITHTCFIDNVENTDWETLAFDQEEYLYIGDIGNNRNNRKELAIYKVKMEDVLKKDTVKAEKIIFIYPEQLQFPPLENRLYYDAEALIYRDNQLFIFTKNRTVPFDGISKIYQVPTELGKYKAKLIDTLQLPATNWREESITDATYYKNRLFVLTYSKVYVLEKEDNQWTIQQTIPFDSWTQKEGIAVDGKYIYLTDENATGIFSNNYLYQLKSP